ncbi:unnamed protein product [Heligmosomoides polygyrus]|uniref:DDE-1 domain-containing protein n=1 Tax=Heligmosomoides polygyrus TaxID=6339 RepID=A0A183FCG5_HELPZ|nr:unnamed protein product [Heligmosomoides polygyrus]
MEAVSDWHQTVLYKELEQFSEENVFNVDETGLFWRLLPNKTLAFKGDRCTSVPLLVIGKSRCFKNASVSAVDYEANQKAWVTAEIYPEKRIIQNLKTHYRRLFLRRRIASIDSSAELSFDLLSAINLLDQA